MTSGIITKEERVKEIREIAEGYYRRGEFHCSEAIIKTFNDELGNPFSDDITKIASGFPIGIGKSGCLCGAVGGGVMALGMVYGRCHGEEQSEIMATRAADLHNKIKELYRSTCCRVLTRNLEFQSPERKTHCIKITGDVAEFIAETLIEDGKLK